MTGLDFEQHLTVNEAAAGLGVHRRTLYRYIANGEIASFKHRGRTYIHKRQIEDYFTRLEELGNAQRRDIATRKRKER